MFNHKGNVCIGNASGETLTQSGQLRIHFISGIVKWMRMWHLALEILCLSWKLDIWVLGKNWLNFPFKIIWNFYMSNVGKYQKKYHSVGTSLIWMLFGRMYSQRLVTLDSERWELSRTTDLEWGTVFFTELGLAGEHLCCYLPIFSCGFLHLYFLSISLENKERKLTS